MHLTLTDQSECKCPLKFKPGKHLLRVVKISKCVCRLFTHATKHYTHTNTCTHAPISFVSGCDKYAKHGGQ